MQSIVVPDDVVAQLRLRTHFRPEDIDDVLGEAVRAQAGDAGAQVRLGILVKTYADIPGYAPARSSWDVFLAILSAAASVASLVIPIVGALGAVYQLKNI